ncbi:MAG: hypothetical protein CMJ78_20655 [Planctomycetaceae bacterium]|nr:hypothetical protein [Planctomycetaceae bacterium]
MSDENSKPKPMKLVWPIVKWSLFVAVLWFVGNRGYSLWSNAQVAETDIEYGWLFVSGLFYFIGWLPSAWFWQRLLLAHGFKVNFLAVVRAYYCGHLGKYIPGKATVLVIRAGLLKASGTPAAVSAVTATYETLGAMGIGVAIAAAFAPELIGNKMRMEFNADQYWLVPTFVGFVVVCLVPLIAKVATLVAKKLTPSSVFGTVDQPDGVTSKVLLSGCLALAIGWCFHGMSLGCTIRAIDAEALQLDQFPLWLSAVSMATAVGFLMIFAPGGLGVREGLLMEALRQRPEFSEQAAVEIAVLLRCVWFVTEVLAAGVLYFGVRSQTLDDPSFNAQP